MGFFQPFPRKFDHDIIGSDDMSRGISMTIYIPRLLRNGRGFETAIPLYGLP